MKLSNNMLDKALASGMKTFTMKAVALLTSASIMLSVTAPTVSATSAAMSGDGNSQVVTMPAGEPAATATPEAPAATATPEVPAATATPEVPAATATPEAPAATATPEAPAATATPEVPATQQAGVMAGAMTFGLEAGVSPVSEEKYTITVEFVDIDGKQLAEPVKFEHIVGTTATNYSKIYNLNSSFTQADGTVLKLVKTTRSDNPTTYIYDVAGLTTDLTYTKVYAKTLTFEEKVSYKVTSGYDEDSVKYYEITVDVTPEAQKQGLSLFLFTVNGNSAQGVQGKTSVTYRVSGNNFKDKISSMLIYLSDYSNKTYKDIPVPALPELTEKLAIENISFANGIFTINAVGATSATGSVHLYENGDYNSQAMAELTFSENSGKLTATFDTTSLTAGNTRSYSFKFAVKSADNEVFENKTINYLTIYSHTGDVVSEGYQDSNTEINTLLPSNEDYLAKYPMASGQKLSTGYTSSNNLRFTWQYDNYGVVTGIASNIKVHQSNMKVYPIILSEVTFDLDGAITSLYTEFKSGEYLLDGNAIPKLDKDTLTQAIRWEGVVDGKTVQLTSSQVEVMSFTQPTSFKAVTLKNNVASDFEVINFDKVYDGNQLLVTNGTTLDNTDIRARFIQENPQFKDYEGLAINVISSEAKHGDNTFEYVVEDVKWVNYNQRNQETLNQSDVAPYTITYNVVLGYDADDKPIYIVDENNEPLVGKVELTIYPRLVHTNIGSTILMQGSNFVVTQDVYAGHGYRMTQISGHWVGEMVGEYVGDVSFKEWYSSTLINPVTNDAKPFFELSGYVNSNLANHWAHEDIKIIHPEIESGNLTNNYQLTYANANVRPVFSYPETITMENYFVTEEASNIMQIQRTVDFDYTKQFDNVGYVLSDGVAQTDFIAKIEGSNGYINMANAIELSGYGDEYQLAIRFWDAESQSFTSETYETPAAVGTYEIPFKVLIADKDGKVLSQEDAAVYFAGVNFSNVQDIVDTTNSYLATVVITPVATEPTPIEPGPTDPPAPVIPLPIIPDVDDTPETEIEEEDVPFAPGPGEVEIEDAEVPLASGAAWALVNLILTILTAITSIMLLISYFKNKDDEEWEEEDAKRKRKGAFRILSVIIAIVSAITFILTEDITLPMILVDRWTLLMAIFAGIQLVVARLSRKEVEVEDEENTAEI